MDKILEIISKYIEQLEEELEWYQQKNREWQEKCEKLEKPELFDKYPVTFMFLGKPIDYWQTLQHYAEINSVDKLFAEVQKLRSENAHLKQAAANHHNNWMTSQQENARLREQLRWHPVSELPRRKIPTSFLSVDVFLDIIGQGTYKAYHSSWSNTWVDRRSNKVIVLPIYGSRWCYIPDDNQGTDCTTEGE